MKVIVRTLSEFSVFAGLDKEALNKIASHVREHAYEPNQIITMAGEPCNGALLIVQGMVSVRRLSIAGREYILNYLDAGECLNIIPALDGGPSLDTLEAVSSTTVYLIPCPRFLQIIQKHQTVAMALLGDLAGQVRYLSDSVEDLALHTVRTRLARFLLTRAKANRPDSRRWTQEEIAAHIGTVRDVVGRTLRNFAREGLIHRERGQLVITDYPRVEREAMQE
jgi:CRP/FNR family transcriptional regulator, cyclic AMP receptor protein